MNKKEQPLNIGILGSGFMGRTYAETIVKSVRGAALAGVAIGTRAPEVAKDYDIPLFDSWEKLVHSDRIDIVFIATPQAQHAELALAAAKAGKHLLIEKPMANSVAECDAIIESCQAQNLKCTIAFTQRFRVCNAEAKKLLDSGRLGRVQQMRTYQMVSDGMANLPAWQMKPENKGILFGHGIHNFDNIRWITGQEIETVYAKCRNTIPGHEIEGTSDVLMTLRDGSTAYLFCSFELGAPGFPRSQFAYRVICEKGFLDIDAYGEARASIDNSPWETIATQAPIDWKGKGFLDPVRLESYADHLQDLVDSIREDRQPLIQAWDGRQAVAAALAAYESSNTGQEIHLR